MGSGVSNTPKAAQEFNWALGLDLLPHDEADPLFCGLQAWTSAPARMLLQISRTAVAYAATHMPSGQS